MGLGEAAVGGLYGLFFMIVAVIAVVIVVLGVVLRIASNSWTCTIRL